MKKAKFIQNTKTGKVLEIKKIDTQSVSLLVYDTDTDIINSSMKVVSIEDLDSLIIPSIVAALGTDYVGSETRINWVFESVGRMYRMRVDKLLFIYETQNKTALGQVLEYQTSNLADFVVNEMDSKYGLTYLQTFEPEYIDMFQPLVDQEKVIMEKLEIDEHGNKSVRRIMDLNEFRTT